MIKPGHPKVLFENLWGLLEWCFCKPYDQWNINYCIQLQSSKEVRMCKLKKANIRVGSTHMFGHCAHALNLWLEFINFISKRTLLFSQLFNLLLLPSWTRISRYSAYTLTAVMLYWQPTATAVTVINSTSKTVIRLRSTVVKICSKSMLCICQKQNDRD